MNNGLSILLVEDEENLHEALKLNLELEGYQVSSARDGAEALRILEQEHIAYSEAIAIVLEGNYEMVGRRVVMKSQIAEGRSKK